MRPREQPTLTDYLLIGINPTLIMLLVGSLVFFLIEAFYQGQYDTRLQFIFALFVMAIVCIARISINEGTGHATLFAIPLAAVTALAMSRFVEYSGPLAGFKTMLNWGLMGLVWWAAHQLTWDCTVIDEAADASGQGLFQQLGWSSKTKPADLSGPALEEPEGLSTLDEPPQSSASLWQSLRERLLRKHTPGVWVVYFSLAALPIFGLGQGFIGWKDPTAQRRAQMLLVLYVGAGLALLVSTSFLNLRRYLRKRRVDVPVHLTLNWLTIGGLIILLVLAVSWVLPGPDVVRWANPIAYSRNLNPSRWGIGNDGPQDPSGKPVARPLTNPSSGSTNQRGPQPGGQQPGNQQQGNSQQGGQQQGGQQQGGQQQGGQQQGGQQQGGQQQGGQQQGGQQQGGQQQGGQQQGGQQQGGQQQGGQQQGGQQQGGQQQGGQPGGGQKQDDNSRTGGGSGSAAAKDMPSSSGSSGAGSSLSQLTQVVATGFSWLVWLVAIVVGLAAAWWFRAALWQAWQQFLSGLRDWLAGLLGWRRESRVGTNDASPNVPLRVPPNWTEFSNPFASGLAGRVEQGELIRYTFAALEAWARHVGQPRQPYETPLEFTRRIRNFDTGLGQAAQEVAELYCQWAFARDGLPAEAAAAAQQLWQRLENSPAPVATLQ